mmetsp:Transcript_83425/g.132044  ORF Transcript_83425/g.132044 Transcript_83425/m.132044 type:complete len:253 (+) Transcript_83425:276-1034(+)
MVSVFVARRPVHAIVVPHTQGFWQHNVFGGVFIGGGKMEPETMHDMHVAGKLSIGQLLRMMIAAWQLRLPPGGRDFQGVGGGAGEAEAAETDASDFFEPFSFRLDDGIPGGLQVVLRHQTVRKEVARFEMKVLIDINRRQQPSGMTLGAVETVLDNLVLSMDLVTGIVVKMDPCCKALAKVWHQHFLYRVFGSSEGIHQKVLDAMKARELQPLHELLQGSTEAGTAFKENVPNTGHAAILLQHRRFPSRLEP